MDRQDKAVALQYTAELPAPIIVARGKGKLAERIKQIAIENAIELVDRADLADALIEFEVGSFIPQEFYQVIAELLIYVRSLYEEA